MRPPGRPHHPLHKFGAMAFLCAMLSGAYYLTGMLYERAGWHPPGVAALIINVVTGMLLMAVVVVVGGLIFRPRHRPRNPFAPITEALDRIGSGDFSARVDSGERSFGMVGELAQSVNHMASRLDEMEKMRQEFVSDVSHEIQSPLTSIRGFACALRNDELGPADRHHYLEIIEAESLRLSRLSDNLLRLAALDKERVLLQPKPYRLDRQLRTLILTCETQWAAKHLELDVELPEATITADEDLLSQVWLNLLHNAIKFTPEQGSVRIGLRRRDANWIVTVSDTGIGIDETDQGRIFERFFKADPSRRHSAGGSGLGLAIARRAVELHQGSIAVNSHPGEGAEFTVTLPAGV